MRNYSRVQNLQDMNDAIMDPWGHSNDALTNSKMCFFRIYEVSPEKRTCSIKTFGSEAAITNADFTNIQWLAPYSNPEGDEINYVPRLGSYGICAFVGGQPYILGYFNPITIDEKEEIIDKENEGVTPAGGSAALNKEKINAGDYILRTLGRCRFALRAGGEIEIEATKICRRTYFPARNRITELSQNLEISTDGGFMNWVHLDQNADSEETVCTQVWKDNINGTNIIKEERGTVEIDTDLIYRFQIAPGANVNEHLADIENPVYFREIHNTGKTEFKINETAYHETISPDGTYVRTIGEGKNLVEVHPSGAMHINIASKWDLSIEESGTTELNVADKCKINIQASGETKIDVGLGKSVITIKPSGEVVMELTQKLEVKSGAEVQITAPKINLNNGVSGITTMNSHLGVVDLITNVPCQPSVTVFSDI